MLHRPSINRHRADAPEEKGAARRPFDSVVCSPAHITGARAARLGRRDVGDAFSAAQFSPRVEIFHL